MNARKVFKLGIYFNLLVVNNFMQIKMNNFDNFTCNPGNVFSEAGSPRKI